MNHTNDKDIKQNDFIVYFVVNSILPLFITLLQKDPTPGPQRTMHVTLLTNLIIIKLLMAKKTKHKDSALIILITRIVYHMTLFLIQH